MIHVTDIPVLQMFDEQAKTPAPVIKRVTFATDDMPASVIESTSIDRRLDELANLLELLTPITAHIENIEREISCMKTCTAGSRL